MGHWVWDGLLLINSCVGNRMETVVQREQTALTPSGTICRCRQQPSQSQLIPRREGFTALPIHKRNIMQALMICLCPCNIKSPCALCTKRRIEELALQEANPTQSIHCLGQQKSWEQMNAMAFTHTLKIMMLTARCTCGYGWEGDQQPSPGQDSCSSLPTVSPSLTLPPHLSA